MRERERELGTEFYSKNPTPNGSRPSDLIGLYRKWQRKKRPQPAKRSSREEGGGDRGCYPRDLIGHKKQFARNLSRKQSKRDTPCERGKKAFREARTATEGFS